MTRVAAIIFDFNGVLERNGTVDDALMSYISADLNSLTTAVFTRMDSRLLTALLMKYKPHPFSHLFTIDTVEAVKPHPEAFRQVARELKLEPAQCLMIDDSTYNVKGAEEAGMQAIHYKGFDELKTALNGLLS